MAVFPIEASGKQTPALQSDFPEKPLSLTVHETAVPFLKKLSFGLEIAAEISMAFAVESILTGNPTMIMISLIAFPIIGILFIASRYFEKTMSKKLNTLNNPEWVRYFSLAYRNRPLEDLIEVLPDPKVWKKLDWNGLEWKRKILPFAEAKGMDRKTLKKEFGSVFDLFNPYMYHYYRKIELHLLQTQGFHAFLDRVGEKSSRKTIKDEEVRAQLLKETQGLTSAQIEEQYPKWVDHYLIPHEDTLWQQSS